MTDPKFRFLCFGVGAAGIYLGISLKKSGHHVTFVDRPESAELVREKGLQLTRGNTLLTVENPDVVPTIEDALTHGPYDAAIFAVKSFDTDRVLKYLQPYQVALPVFICIQNGIGNEARLVDVFGPDKVIPAVMTTSVRRRAVGEAEVLHVRGIGMSGRHQLTAALMNAFNQAGLRVKRYRDPASMKWSKLLLNLMTNASAAILQMTPEEIIRDPELRQIEIQQLQEAIQVMETQHIRLVNLPGFPLRWVNLLMSNQIRSTVRDLVLTRMVIESLGDAMPLLAVDLQAGKQESEVANLNGAVLRHALQSDISVPINAAYYSLLLGIAGGKIKSESYSHNKSAFLSYVKNFQMPSKY